MLILFAYKCTFHFLPASPLLLTSLLTPLHGPTQGSTRKTPAFNGETTRAVRSPSLPKPFLFDSSASLTKLSLSSDRRGYEHGVRIARRFVSSPLARPPQPSAHSDEPPSNLQKWSRSTASYRTTSSKRLSPPVRLPCSPVLLFPHLCLLENVCPGSPCSPPRRAHHRLVPSPSRRRAKSPQPNFARWRQVRPHSFLPFPSSRADNPNARTGASTSSTAVCSRGTMSRSMRSGPFRG